MKKIILVIMIIAITLTTSVLVACSQVNQLNMLSMGWLDYECYTYNVYHTEGKDSTVIGTMTYTYTRVDGEVEVNGKKFNQSHGAMIETKLTISGGEYQGSTMESVVVFSSTFVPTASYKKFVCSDDSLSYTSFADYTKSSKNGTFTYTDKDCETTSEFKKSGAYDNECLYTLIRASVFENQNYSISMRVPDNSTYELRTVAIGKATADAKTKCDYQNSEFTCTVIAARVTSKKGSSTTHTVHYSNTPIKVDGKDIVKPIVQIVEGDYKFVLASVTTIKNKDTSLLVEDWLDKINFPYDSQS